MVIPCNLPETMCISTRGPNAAIGDVCFVVGPESDTWTIIGNRSILIQKSHVFAELLQNQFTRIRIVDVDKKGFEILLRYLEDTTAIFTSVRTARSTLDVAYRYECRGLAQACILYLEQNLTIPNVLTIYKNLQSLTNYNIQSTEPSAPPLEHHLPITTDKIHIKNSCTTLLDKVLDLIDKKANEMLQRDEFDELVYNDVWRIVTRDTLQIQDELIVFRCLFRWYKCECMKRNCLIGPISRRDILKDLIYQIRFGLMGKDLFLDEAMHSAIFNSEELKDILTVFEIQPGEVSERFKDMNRPRVYQALQDANMNTEKMKNKKPSKFVLNCLSVFTAIFD